MINKVRPTGKIAFLGGIILAILVMNTVVFIFEKSPYENNFQTVDGLNWNFSTGLSLSSELVFREKNLVSFGVSSGIIVNTGNIDTVQPNAVFTTGIVGIGGLIIPTNIPMTYDLHNDLGNYKLDIQYARRTLGTILGSDASTNVKPDSLSPLSKGLATLLSVDNKLEKITYDQYITLYQGQHKLDVQIMSITHLYQGGYQLKIQIIGDTVFFIFDTMDVIDFGSDGSICTCRYTSGGSPANLDYYYVNINNIDLSPYIYAVNEVIHNNF